MKLSHRIGACLAAIGVSVILGLAGAPRALAAQGEPCPNEQLRAESNLNPNTNLPYSMELPDCRGYELVSPPYEEGKQIEGFQGVSGDGTTLIGQDLGSFAGSEDEETFGAYYEFTRTPPEGWQTTALNPPAAQFPGGALVDVGRDFGTTLWNLRKSTEPELASSFYLREPTSDGSCPSAATQVGAACFVEVGPMFPASSVAGPPDPVGEAVSDYYRGASADLSHIVFQDYGQTSWPGDTTLGSGIKATKVTTNSLYEYVGTGNSEPKLVGVSNVGQFAHDTEAHLISDCGTLLGGSVSEDQVVEEYNAISTSGEAVFFTAVAGPCTREVSSGVIQTGEGPAVNELYARIGEEKTLALSEPPLTGPGSVPGRECTGTCETEENTAADRKPAVYQGASEDGSKVFFMTEQPLVNADADSANDLYEEEIEGEGMNAKVGKLVQVSHDPNAGQAAEVQGVARVSEDGSRVYFVAKGALTSEPDRSLTPGHQTAVAGEDNLYVYERDSAHPNGQLAFVATLSPSDSADWKPLDEARPVQATLDGEFLVFESAADLTPDDTSTVTQIFEYDAATGELVRVSIGACPEAKPACAPGEREDDDGNTESDPASLNPSLFSAVSSPVDYQTHRALSEDGAYVFFASTDRLTPSATARVQDVYEYHWGEGFLSDGNIDLLANGLEPSGPQSEAEGGGKRLAKFESTDASGEDAFIETPLQLVGQDTDTQTNIYDARLDGGFPAPASPPPECSGEACQGSLGGPPLLPSAASTGTPAVGNLAPGSSTFPTEEAKPKPKPLTKAQELAKALKQCKRDKAKAKRRQCEKSARRSYAPKTKAKKKV